MVPSEFQQKIYDTFKSTRGNINIQAVAGSGKTTTLLELVKLVPRGQSTLFLAFNKSIVNELKERNKRHGVDILTIHSCGWRALLSRYGSDIKLNIAKSIAKTKEVMKDVDSKITPKQKSALLYNVPKLLDMMRCNLSDNSQESIEEILLKYDIDIDGLEIKHVQKAFALMMKDRKNFDFMDMVYLPAVDDNIRLKQYDNVFCDESQDFSSAQQRFIARCIKPRTGRLVSVGDRMQSIYGFAGADANSYEKMARVNGDSTELPLSVCYRCARKIVEMAQTVVPYIQPSPTAKEGRCGIDTLQNIQDGDWVLCRNLKPLVDAYIWLTSNKIKSYIKGRDIGESIIRLIEKTKTNNLDKMFDLLDDEVQKLIASLIDKGVTKPRRHPKYEQLSQKIDVINALVEEVEDVDGLLNLIQSIFKDESKDGITLCTIHRSKGLENDRVYLICPELLPSRFATQDWELEQERNLLYVAYTRAKSELYIVPQSVFEADIKEKLQSLQTSNK